MSINLTQFSIIGLHGKLDIKIPIRDNKLILIGVNGLGKTTVVNFIYFVLTDQWARLMDYEFSEIEMVIDDQYVKIDKADIRSKVRSSELHQRQLQRLSGRYTFPPRMLRSVMGHPLYKEYLTAPLSSNFFANIARVISKDTEIPLATLSRIAQELNRDANRELFPEATEPPSIATLSNVLKDSGKNKVIYLPTYRRIEQDLKSVFPNVDENELRNLANAAETTLGNRSKGHVELVQFGMQDVESKISEELDLIRKSTSSQLSNLTGTYLQDIISNRAGEIPHDLLRVIPVEAVASVLGRVDENTLSAGDKKEVEAAIRRIKADATNSDVRDGYLAYFFGRLFDIYNDLYNNEANIRLLMETCNRYLERKRLNYNDQTFTMEILDDEGASLEWKMLSSGEKQVASLFTHLYLSKEESHIVIIDEPELSLSVPWQKALLPDIVEARNCNLLIAVTHSPFIYSNELDKYAVDLGRLITLGDK